MINKKLKKYIQNVDLVSFDLYDTLITRLVQKPEDIFYIVEEVYNQHFNRKINNFKRERINAEIKARKNSKFNEINLNDIYNILKGVYNKYNLNALKDIEKELENRLIIVNENIFEVLNYCKICEKKIIISSDIYLEQNLIKEILKNNQIYYDDLFISCELNVKKSDGNMFKHIINNYKIKANKILHIGDNIKSDFLIPKFLGLKVYRIKNKKPKKYINYKVGLLNKYIEYNLKQKNVNNYFYNFGYKNLGPLIFGFCEYLNSNINSNSNIIFLSREGKFILECFNILNKSKNQCKYMNVSRKSITNCLLSSKQNIEKVIKMQSVSQNETVEMFLNRLNLTNNSFIINELKKYNISLLAKYFNEEIRYKLAEIIELACQNISKKDYDNFNLYLKQLDFNNDTIVVDIGWNGTMQDLLQIFLDKQNIKIKGYYLGVRKKRKTELKQGYLFNGNNDEFEMASRGMVGFLETLFAANHGSTAFYKYVKATNSIEPILSDLDINNISIENIEKIQNGAKDFIKDFKNNYINSLNILEYKDLNYNLLKIGVKPTLNDINYFKIIETFDEKTILLINNKTLFEYLFNLKAFKLDFIESPWKFAFLKNVFKLKLPYYILFKFAYKRRHL